MAAVPSVPWGENRRRAEKDLIVVEARLPRDSGSSGKRARAPLLDCVLRLGHMSFGGWGAVFISIYLVICNCEEPAQMVLYSWHLVLLVCKDVRFIRETQEVIKPRLLKCQLHGALRNH